MANFTPRAQQALAHARKEADRLHHNFVGTEHLLLGLACLGQGTAVTVLGKMGLNLETIRSEVEKQVGLGPDQKVIGFIPYTPRVKKVLALAAKEARALSHTYVGTEHILLGLLMEGGGVAPRVLKNLGVDTEKTRQEILRELDPNNERTSMDTTPTEAADAIDIGKRYDIYCTEPGGRVMVYRNAIFKARAKLLSTRQHDSFSDFLELEQSNGQTIYLSRHSVIKFCAPGAELTGEILPSK